MEYMYISHINNFRECLREIKDNRFFCGIPVWYLKKTCINNVPHYLGWRGDPPIKQYNKIVTTPSYHPIFHYKKECVHKTMYSEMNGYRIMTQSIYDLKFWKNFKI
jgi:hypothetical protein